MQFARCIGKYIVFHIWCLMFYQCLAQKGNLISFYLYPGNNTAPIKMILGEKLYYPLNPEVPTKIIIHGFIAHRNHPSILPVRKAYVKVGGYNVIIGDWEQASFQEYGDARRTVPALGTAIAKLVENLVTYYGIQLKDVHLIGHSLGAHIVGEAGRRLRGQVARVTGLDPALPLFTARDPDFLRKDAAVFVDVIHTCGSFLGIVDWCGHADFYPNNGFFPQPGCRMTDVILLGACSHFRAPYYFAESIENPNAFPAVNCPLSMLQKCDSSPSEFMGEPTTSKARGLYYLVTNNKEPYGLGMNGIPIK